MGKTVALVPAFNEQTRISRVLEVILSSDLVDETVVIDDGSLDDTSAEAGRYPVRLLNSWKKNRGKGAALQAGIEAAPDAGYYLFLDADLVSLGQQHIERLLAPLHDQRPCAMTIGVFRGGERRRVNFVQKYFSILNGQRGLRRDFVEILPDLSHCRFGVEVLLTKYAKIAEKHVLYPELEGISHITKEEKFGFWNGFKYRLQMYNECLYALKNYKKMIIANPGNIPPEILRKITYKAINN